MASLRDLFKFERGLFDSLANLEDFVENFDAKRDAARVESRLERLETVFKDFMENRARLESKHEQDLSSASEPKDPEAKEKKQQARETNKVTRLDFENRYLDLKDFLVSKRVKPTAEASSLAPPPANPCPLDFNSLVSKSHPLTVI
uniref:(northern house mosquito) hypothetical protein n=1 Tax=Culex pipiens TaxID=7175 RepID=A0A8D8I7G6_CULPI